MPQYNITNLPQWFTKVLCGASTSTGSRQLRPRKIFSHWIRRSFNDAIHGEKKFEAKRSWQQTKAAQPVETEDIEKVWSSGAIGLQNPRSLLHLVWWNNVTHLGMRGFKEQHDCQLSDFTVTELSIKYKEWQTKNRQGDESTASKRARKYNNKI